MLGALVFDVVQIQAAHRNGGDRCVNDQKQSIAIIPIQKFKPRAASAFLGIRRFPPEAGIRTEPAFGRGRKFDHLA
jgi:hypothetical protein